MGWRVQLKEKQCEPPEATMSQTCRPDTPFGATARKRCGALFHLLLRGVSVTLAPPGGCTAAGSRCGLVAENKAENGEGCRLAQPSSRPSLDLGVMLPGATAERISVCCMRSTHPYKHATRGAAKSSRDSEAGAALSA